MGTFIDCEYFCKGDKASVEKARKCIERFQNANAAYSGNGNCDFSAPPDVAADGMSLKYGCYTTGSMEALDSSLIRLTKSGGMVLFNYEGCTDGTNFGELVSFEHGKLSVRHCFNADIGLRASMAIAELAKGKDEAAFASLVESYSDSTGGGFIGERWEADLADEDFEDDGDNSEMEKNGLIAGLIGAALATYPELLASPRINKALLRLSRSFVYTKGWMSKFELCEPSINQSVDGLIARLESLEIGKVAKAPTRKSARRGGARESVRI